MQKLSGRRKTLFGVYVCALGNDGREAFFYASGFRKFLQKDADGINIRSRIALVIAVLFWCRIATGPDLIGIEWRALAVGTGSPEVDKLECAVIADDDVGGLDIPVDDGRILAVKEAEDAAKLGNMIEDFLGCARLFGKFCSKIPAGNVIIINKRVVIEPFDLVDFREPRVGKGGDPFINGDQLQRHLFANGKRSCFCVRNKVDVWLLDGFDCIVKFKHRIPFAIA